MKPSTSILARVVAVLIAAGGAVAIVAGSIAWGMTSSELAAQKIDVSTEGEPARYADDPFDAFAQVSLIKEHTAAAIVKMGYPEGTVYTDIAMPDSARLAECATVASSARTDECAGLVRDDAARSFFDNSNFKQASLYTSVLAFGTSAILIAVGLALVAIAALILVMLGRRTASASAA